MNAESYFLDTKAWQKLFPQSWQMMSLYLFLQRKFVVRVCTEGHIFLIRKNVLNLKLFFSFIRIWDQKWNNTEQHKHIPFLMIFSQVVKISIATTDARCCTNKERSNNPPKLCPYIINTRSLAHSESKIINERGHPRVYKQYKLAIYSTLIHFINVHIY